MFRAIGFHNFKALREATLPLSPFTLIVGPNGSGKSSALQALKILGRQESITPAAMSAGIESNDEAVIELTFHWNFPDFDGRSVLSWNSRQGHAGPIQYDRHGRPMNMHDNQVVQELLRETLDSISVYALDARAIAQPQPEARDPELHANGGNLPIVLSRMRDRSPTRYGQLNAEMARWLPEFASIEFDVTGEGHRRFDLQTRQGGHRIPADQLSQGTLFALTLLTIAYLPRPPKIVGLEEPDRGMHPRLLRDLRDAMYRLSHPEAFSEDRPPTQVIATTHSPYLLDQFREHTEEVVIASKDDSGARFERLSERPDVDEILEDSSLGDAWYSGVLGGVPVAS